MKKILAILVVFMLLQLAVADEAASNDSDGNDTLDANDSDEVEPEPISEPEGPNASWLPNVTIPENITETGISTIDQITNFLGDASPFLLLIIGVLLIVLSGFGKLIGIILIILALISKGETNVKISVCVSPIASTGKDSFNSIPLGGICRM